MSEKDAATVLEDAADWLLVNGRCRTTLSDAEGRGCVIHALMRSADLDAGSSGYVSAMDALNQHVWTTTKRFGVVDWNERTEDDDEVRDTLLLVAKQLRGEANP